MKESNENKKSWEDAKERAAEGEKKTQPGLQHTGLEIF